jgi:hypothetical protein
MKKYFVGSIGLATVALFTIAPSAQACIIYSGIVLDCGFTEVTTPTPTPTPVATTTAPVVVPAPTPVATTTPVIAPVATTTPVVVATTTPVVVTPTPTPVPAPAPVVSSASKVEGKGIVTSYSATKVVVNGVTLKIVGTTIIKSEAGKYLTVGLPVEYKGVKNADGSITAISVKQQ